MGKEMKINFTRTNFTIFFFPPEEANFLFLYILQQIKIIA